MIIFFILSKTNCLYYIAIQNCNNAENSNEFMIKVINESVDGMIVTSNQEKIINLIKKNPAITQVEMAKILDLTREGVSYNIKF